MIALVLFTSYLNPVEGKGSDKTSLLCSATAKPVPTRMDKLTYRAR